MYMLNNKVVKVVLAVVAVVAMVALCAKCWADDMARQRHLEQAAADEMAQCWADYAKNLNGGGCRFEYHYTDGGQTLYAVEVVAEPLN